MAWRFVWEAGAWAISQTPLRLIVAVNFEYILYFDEQEESNICNITNGIFERVSPIGWFHPSHINGPIKIEKKNYVRIDINLYEYHVPIYIHLY